MAEGNPRRAIQMIRVINFHILSGGPAGRFLEWRTRDRETKNSIVFSQGPERGLSVGGTAAGIAARSGDELSRHFRTGTLR